MSAGLLTICVIREICDSMSDETKKREKDERRRREIEKLMQSMERTAPKADADLLRSTPLGLRHLLRERNFSSGGVCGAIAPGRAAGGSQDREGSGAFVKPVEKHGSFGFAVRALVRPGSDP